MLGESTQTEHNAFVLAVASGKSGVGKTTVTSNLGVSLAAAGLRVCLLDADDGSSGIDELFGLRVEYTLEDILEGRKRLQDVVVAGPGGIRIVPAASGIAEFIDMAVARQDRVLQVLDELERQFDYLLIDVPAGISSSAISFLSAVPDTILILSPEPTSTTDAFSLLRVLQEQGSRTRLHVLVNNAKDRATGLSVFHRFKGAVRKHLDSDVDYLGYIPGDPQMVSATKSQIPLLMYASQSPACRALRRLAEEIDKLRPAAGKPEELSKYWCRLKRAASPIDAQVSQPRGDTESIAVDTLLEEAESAWEQGKISTADLRYLVTNLQRRLGDRPVDQEESVSPRDDFIGLLEATTYAARLGAIEGS